MSKNFHQHSLATLLTGFALVALPSISYATHSWGGYHWARTTSPFTLKLGDNLTSADWKAKLAQASLDWNNPQTFQTTSPVTTTIVSGSAGSSCSMKTGTVQVCNKTYGKNGWLGLASINITAGIHITQGSAKMNDTYFNMSQYNNTNERLHVMCQEIAHAFGLDHQSTNGSSQNTCMDYFSNTGVNAGSTLSTKPNAHDFEQLNTIYTHFDSTTTVAASALTTSFAQKSDNDAEETDDPNKWGQLRSQSHNGRSSTYERFNKDGSQTLIHVYWIEDVAKNCPRCDHRYDH